MAPILTPLVATLIPSWFAQAAFYLALGFLIGWWLKSRLWPPTYINPPRPPDGDREREWREHAERHAEDQKESTVWTAPGPCRVERINGFDRHGS